MKKKISVLILAATMLIVLVANGSGTAFAQSGITPSPVILGVTPTPAGEINVPAFSIQIFAPGVNPLRFIPDTSNRVAGLFIGIWHGIISPITLIVSFINPAIQMYEVHNDGGPYNLGFLIGVALVFFLLGVVGGRRRRR